MGFLLSNVLNVPVSEWSPAHHAALAVVISPVARIGHRCSRPPDPHRHQHAHILESQRMTTVNLVASLVSQRPTPAAYADRPVQVTVESATGSEKDILGPDNGTTLWVAGMLTGR